MLLASVVTDEVGAILNDMEAGHEHTRWPESELLVYLTEAISAIAQGKPSVFTVSAQISLAPGSTQRLPDAYCKLLNIQFNVNQDGSEGSNVLPGVYELQQAFQKPFCSFDGVIQSYSYFPSSDRYFDVTPAVPQGLSYTPQVRAILMVTPQVVTDSNQPLFFPGSDPSLYQAALVDWLLYRCYSKDEQSNTSLERSQAHFKSFMTYVGIAAMSYQATQKAQSARQQKVAA